MVDLGGGAPVVVGPGKGPVYGTRVHSAFEGEVAALGRSDVFTEVSYLNGQVVPRGTPGSVWLDAVVGSPGAPTAIYDLKTGSAVLTPAALLRFSPSCRPDFRTSQSWSFGHDASSMEAAIGPTTWGGLAVLSIPRLLRACRVGA